MRFRLISALLGITIISMMFGMLAWFLTPQGEVVTRWQASRIYRGMNSDQVTTVLGVPKIQTGKDANLRWTYFFEPSEPTYSMSEHLFTISFDEKGNVTNFWRWNGVLPHPSHTFLNSWPPPGYKRYRN